MSLAGEISNGSRLTCLKAAYVDSNTSGTSSDVQEKSNLEKEGKEENKAEKHVGPALVVSTTSAASPSTTNKNQQPKSILKKRSKPEDNKQGSV